MPTTFRIIEETQKSIITNQLNAIPGKRMKTSKVLKMRAALKV
jgi:hypothetical protein